MTPSPAYAGTTQGAQEGHIGPLTRPATQAGLSRGGQSYWVPASAGRAQERRKHTCWIPAYAGSPPLLFVRARHRGGKDTVSRHKEAWIPAFAGMTQGRGKDTGPTSPGGAFGTGGLWTARGEAEGAAETAAVPQASSPASP